MKIPDIELKSKATVPQLGLGTYKLTGTSCYNLVKDAISLGYRHIDTAEYYGNEDPIGAAIRQIDRKMLFITSKVWRDNLRYEDVIKACEKTIRNLNTDYLDLYLVHWPNSSIPLKETLDAMQYLHEKKRIRTIGVSNFPIERVKEAMLLSKLPICIDQVEFHVFLHQPGLLDFCNKNNIRITAYSPLAKGAVYKENYLIELGKKHKKTAGQIALRWLIEKGIIAIPKGSTREHIKENMEIFDFKLNDKEISEIDKLPQHRIVAPVFSEF